MGSERSSRHHQSQRYKPYSWSSEVAGFSHQVEYVPATNNNQQNGTFLVFQKGKIALYIKNTVKSNAQNIQSKHCC